MMSDFPGDQPDYRVSDADRDAAMAELGEHLQAGRLSSEEFGQRLDSAAAARTRSDLDRLMADLPRQARQAPAPAQPRARRLAPGAAVLVVVAAVAAAVAIPAAGGSLAGWHMHTHSHWITSWWLIVIPVLLLRRVLWRGSRRGRR